MPSRASRNEEGLIALGYQVIQLEVAVDNLIERVEMLEAKIRSLLDVVSNRE